MNSMRGSIPFPFLVQLEFSFEFEVPRGVMLLGCTSDRFGFAMRLDIGMNAHDAESLFAGSGHGVQHGVLEGGHGLILGVYGETSIKQLFSKKAIFFLYCVSI